MPTSSALKHLTAVLQLLAGPQAVPRADQLAAVDAVLQPAARVLVVQATGWGKSAVYWAATTALRKAGGGTTLVISPLLALMRDQVTAAGKAGLKAESINSTNIDDWDPVFQALKNNQLDVLLVSPERLGNPAFAARLPQLLAQTSLIVIDEAHCISDWGFDFRPDYQRLARSLLAAPNAAVLATTATANERVTDDVRRQLGNGTAVFRGTLARTSLRLSVIPGLSAVERFAWIADALQTLPGSGIIYTLTVAEAERLAGYLRRCGFDVPAYTGQTETADRLHIEQQLRKNELKAVVATSALGMGYDKPDLGFCLHLGSPGTPVAYYQQIGRAGRALTHAEAILLPGSGDEAIWEYFATANIPSQENADRVLTALSERPQSVIDLEGATAIRRGRLEALLRILAVDNAVEKDGSKWTATGRPWMLDSRKWDALLAGRREEADLMRNYAHGRGCLMAYLQQALSDPNPAPCGKCSVCTGQLPEPGLHPSASAINEARRFLRQQDVIFEPRKIWPKGCTRKGTISAKLAARAVAFADDPGWTEELEALARSGMTIVPSGLLDGAVSLLQRWKNDWEQRPALVMPAPAPDSEMQSNRQFANHISTIGRLPLFDAFSWQGPACPENQPSASHVKHLEKAIRLQKLTDLPAGPVLLCATTARTCWTMTLAAALLSEAGVKSVMAIVLHRQP
ncbi:MAG: RecQ family ATP-dependent DNA helicase [Planctomycetales bacterium]|jgi:ATP-dependent DNA helicase RecQ|nr:RecQ family ATP-dependent DNA helicase [Planctomycetales bacterium]